MRQNGPQRRGRGRPSGRRGFSNSPNRSYDSSGPDVKIRGTAATVYDKYQALGRDAVLSGDRIAAENFFQHAEHYYRLLQAAKEQAGENEQRDSRRQGQQSQSDRGNETSTAGRDEKSPTTAESAADEMADVRETAADSAAMDADGADNSEASQVVAGNADIGDTDSAEADAERSAPMNPAELAAMSEGNRKGRNANGANGRGRGSRGNAGPDDDAENDAEGAPRRQPRRRRRPVAEVGAEAESAPTDVVEDIEPS